MSTKIIYKTAALIFNLLIISLWIENSSFAGNKVNISSDLEKFLMETFNIELQGIRWAELTGRSKKKIFYSRFLWSKDFEPGWDILYITNSITIQSITFSEKLEYELVKNDKVITQISPGYIITVAFDNFYVFTRRSYEEVKLEYKILKIILTDSGPRFVDRIHPPHFGYKAALDVLNSEPWKSKDFSRLKNILSKKLRVNYNEKEK